MQSELVDCSRLVETMLVVDIDPSLTLFRPNQQKWVSSLELLPEPHRDPKNNAKTIHLAPGIYLTLNYCEKNRPPIYDIDFLPQPSPEWIPLKGPHGVAERLGGTTLCYKAGDCPSFEPLTDVELLITERKRLNDQKEVFVLPAGYKTVNNNPIPHGILIYRRMKSPLEQTFKAVLTQKYPEHYNGVTLSMVPLFCFPEGIRLAKQLKGFINFNFILTTEMGDRYYCNCLTFKQNMESSLKQKLGLPNQDSIFYEKGICLISRHRYTDEFAECLKHLYRLSMSKNDVPFHRVISSFVNGLKLPKELGINGMSYSYGGSNINFDTNPSYPVISEKSIYCLFKFLPLTSIISVFEALLLEKKVIFVSQSKTVLGYAVEAFLAFVFPFRWEHVLIPILPSTLKEYLNAPVPLIAGISPQMLDRNIQSDSIIVQLDQGSILNDEDLPPLPDKMEKQLRKRLEHYELYDEEDVREYLQNPESTYIFKMQEVEHPEFQGHIIRDCFYQFMLTLMKNYKKFWKQQKYKDSKQNSSIGLTEPQLLNDMFRLQDFLSDLGMTKVGSFGYKLTEGTIFTSFIERRSQSAEDPELVFFDESIDRKKAKKEIKLIEKVSNIRYNVAEHPKPQSEKQTFQYDRFPSILDGAIREAQVMVQIDSVNEEELEILQDFLERQFCQHRRLYAESDSDDMDYKIQSLLLQKFKLKYGDYCQQNGTASRVENIRTSIVGKIRNSREIYDKLLYFQKIYFQQMNYMEQVLSNWPRNKGKTGKTREISKRDYLKQYLRDSFEEDQLVCLYEEYWSEKHRNFEAMMLGATRLNLMENRQDGRQGTFENPRGSKKHIKHQYEIYIEHSRLRSFINTVIPEQGHSFFGFALQQLQQDNSAVWTFDTLLLWRDSLANP